MKFITEIINRIGMKSPSFFRIMQWISIAVAAISGLPALIAQFQNDLGVTLPDWMLSISSKLVAISAIVAWVMAKLPVSNAEAVKEKSNGEVVPKLPFTKS